MSIPTPERVKTYDGEASCIVRYEVETPDGWLGAWDEAAFHAYAAAVIFAERERCAKMCEQEGERWRGEQDITDFKLCAFIIRGA